MHPFSFFVIITSISTIKEENYLLALFAQKKTKKYLTTTLLFFFLLSLIPFIALADSRVDVFAYVRDDDNGNPIYNAKVDLFYDYESVPFISLYTDNNGRIDNTIYANKDIKRVEVSRSGYAKKNINIDRQSSRLDLGSLYLKPGSSSATGEAKVYGTILDKRDGSYITDARITLVDDYDGIVYATYTNSRGRFDLLDIPLGDYEVRITKYGYKDYERSNLLRLRAYSYDFGTLELESTSSSTDSSVRRNLTGRVLDEDGYYVQTATVYLLDKDGREIETRTDSRGYYSFERLEAGIYTIGVTAAGFDMLERIDYVKIDSSDREREVDLVIKKETKRGYEVYGRVVDKNRDHLADVEVSLLDGNSRIKKTKTDSRGYYEIDYVANGRYSIEFKKPGYKTVKLTDEVRVNNTYYSVSQVQLELSQGTSTLIGGLVGDSQSGLNGLSVYLENNLDKYTAKTNYYGYFTFSEIREGRYDLYATINNQKKLLESDITVRSGRLDIGDINVNRIDKGYQLSGRVKDEDGYSLSDVLVEISGAGSKKEARTNSSGNYTITGLERSSYELIVSKDGYGRESESINVTSYDLEKNFTLRANDYVKVTSKDISLALNERIDLYPYISRAEIYSSQNRVLDNITSSFEIIVPEAYRDYLTAYSDRTLRAHKVGTAYIDISIANSRDYKNLSPARLKVEITESKEKREAVLTIGSNYYVLNGKTELSDATPYLKDDRSFFPIRVISKVLGVEGDNVKWDSITNTVTLIKGNDTVEFTVGRKVYRQNSVSMDMDVSPENINGRVYLPARYVSDALGGEIEWDNFTKSLTIISH